jgi:hypothetical protein
MGHEGEVSAAVVRDTIAIEGGRRIDTLLTRFGLTGLHV